MSIIEKTWNIVEQFTSSPEYVTINEKNAKDLAVHIKSHISEAKEFFIGKPRWMKEISWTPRFNEAYELIGYELLLDSANYNYWYGKGNIRPNGASSHEMSKLLDESFTWAHLLAAGGSPSVCKMAGNRFQQLLIRERYPNLENRLRHIKEIYSVFNSQSAYIECLLHTLEAGTEDAEVVIGEIIEKFPGFASDIFLKRAFLFIIEMNRRMGWFKNDIHKIPIPADYQIPKMLNYYGVLMYDDRLKKKIESHELIQSGSLMECEIRATAMKACQIIANKADITMADVDTYLFANRKKSVSPFHLTITTDY